MAAAALLAAGGAGRLVGRRLGGERVLHLLATLPWFPFFSRVSRGEALDHPRRRLIHNYLQHHPGVRLRFLGEELELSRGVTAHHLRVLRAHGLVVLERRGSTVRLWLLGQSMAWPPEPEAIELERLVRALPGVSMGDAAHRLGWSRRKVSYWAGLLVVRGLLVQRAQGVRRRLASVA